MIDLKIIIILIFSLLLIIISYIIGKKIGSMRRDKHWELTMPLERKDAIMRSRSVLSGQFSEQLAPYLPGFNFSPTECKFLGKPIDFIVFKGMDNKKIDEVVFLEIKTSKSKLSDQEKNLKEAIEKKRVRWEELRINLDNDSKDNNKLEEI